jgi:PP-loop superfamily ATP-utilizing enzyme
VIPGTAFHNSMSKLDRLKEELGWLKVVFAVSAAIDASLVAWLAQAYTTATTTLVVVALVAAACLSVFLLWINRAAYRRMRELENL